MKIYTRTGDKGTSSLWGGKRLSKASLRMETYGTVDELNSIIGVILANTELDEQLAKSLLRIQGELMVLGSDLATPLSVSKKLKTLRIKKTEINRLEKEIDKFSEKLPQLTSFILPSGSFTASLLHHARTVCRRAERVCVGLYQAEPDEVNQLVLMYVNRLSDWLFTAARYQNHREGKKETAWIVKKRQA